MKVLFSCSTLHFYLFKISYKQSTLISGSVFLKFYSKKKINFSQVFLVKNAKSKKKYRNKFIQDLKKGEEIRVLQSEPSSELEQDSSS